MKSILKLIRRFVGILFLSTVLLLIVNLIVLATVMSQQKPNARPWKMAEEAAAALHQTDSGYSLTEEVAEKLTSQNVWAFFIDNTTLQIIWKSDNLPDYIPTTFTASDIAHFTRGYLNNFPIFTGESEHGLMVLGYPPNSFWKHMWPSWDYQLIANFPKLVLFILAFNIAIIFLIYMTANSKLLQSIKPIASGIQELPTGNPIHIREKGILSELAADINKTSEVLQSQNFQLRKKETARANWIAGVSHDIRTPLSMVMGYAGQLEEDSLLSISQRRKASVIRRESERIRNLINDLNLASKLEYNMQPILFQKENAVAIARQVIVDFINNDIENKYSFVWQTKENFPACFINCDRNLLKRAISNLIQNCINHNKNGCKIYVSVHTDNKSCVISIEDDGIGASDEEITRLNTAPHYMVCDTNTDEQRHGLGLLIVKQITASHKGTISITHSTHGGFAVKLFLPLA